MKMELVDEDPPDLVEMEEHNGTSADDVMSGLQPRIEDLSVSKVPLTLITGRLCCRIIGELKV